MILNTNKSQLFIPIIFYITLYKQNETNISKNKLFVTTCKIFFIYIYQILILNFKYIHMYLLNNTNCKKNIQNILYNKNLNKMINYFN